MATKYYLTIGFWLAVALLGASPKVVCVAQEAHSGDGAAERSAVSGSEAAVPNTPNSGTQSVPGASGDAAKISTGEGAPREPGAGGNAEAIDTRITVVPRRPGGGRDKVGGSRAVKLVAPRNLLARRVAVPNGTEPVVRNALGAVVPRREGFDQHNRERLSIVVPNSASGASGLADSAIGRITKSQGSSGRPPRLIVRPVVVNRSAVNGTSLIRHGFAPSGIGGPAKTVAGINGTTIKSPH